MLFINARHAEDVEANANLIAAAPELLEILEEVIKDYREGADEWVGDALFYALELADKADRIIAKAKGELK